MLNRVERFVYTKYMQINIISNSFGIHKGKNLFIINEALHFDVLRNVTF